MSRYYVHKALETRLGGCNQLFQVVSCYVWIHHKKYLGKSQECHLDTKNFVDAVGSLETLRTFSSLAMLLEFDVWEVSNKMLRLF